MRAALLAAGLLAAAPALADEVRLPAAFLDRTGPVIALWRPDTPAAGTLLLEWTDGAGRLVEQHRVGIASPLPEVAVPLDMRRAREGANQVTARFEPREPGPATRAEASFVARPRRGWARHHVVLWQDPAPGALNGLPALGITGLKLLRPLSQAGQATAAQRAALGLRWYTENLATDFYAPYHRWAQGRSPIWLFDETKALHRRRPDDPAAFHRTPSLSDPTWLATVSIRLEEVARLQAPYRPLFHDLADESGIADLAAAWDFDLSPASLGEMRVWLRERHGTLAGLNRAWGTGFADWDAVVPALTRDALRDDAAVPSWMEFKAWMDVAFARAVRAGTDAVHRGDPEGLAAIAGAQVPGWGGYDYGLLAPAVDAMEIYDLGNAIEIASSLNPDLRVLTTSFGDGAAERHRLWRALLLGARGTVVWDEEGAVVGADGRPGPRGARLAPVWRELTGALGAQLLDARPALGRVAILYSQASFRATWLLDRRPGGDAWVERDAEAEGADNAWRAATRRAVRGLANLGAQPRWITPETLTAGGLMRDGTRVLVLPHSIALSAAEVEAVRGFAEAGGLVVADTQPGQRDELGRTRAAPPFADLAAAGRLRVAEALRTDVEDPGEAAALLAEAGVRSPFALVGADGRPPVGLEVRLFRNGDTLIAGIQRQDGAEGVRSVELRLPDAAWIRPLRGSAPASVADTLTLHLDPVEPSILVLSPLQPPGPTLAAPSQAARGDLLALRVALDGPTSAAAHFVQVDAFDPSGQARSNLAEAIRVPPEGATYHLPLALNDPLGRWEIRAVDVVSGRVATAVLDVR